jgi:hypothetical protein
VSLADELTEAIRPLAETGNPYASLSLMRMAVAEDPDTIAQQILEELEVLAGYVMAVIRDMQPLLDWWRDAMGPN